MDAESHTDVEAGLHSRTIATLIRMVVQLFTGSCRRIC